MKAAIFALLLLSLAFAQSYDVAMVRANDSAITSMVYDNSSASYADNSIANPDAMLSICSQGGAPLLNQWVALAYADGLDGDYIPVQHAPVQVASVNASNCTIVPLEISSFLAWYPSIPYVFIAPAPGLAGATRWTLSTADWFVGAYGVSSSQVGSVVNVTVTGVADDQGHAIVPVVPYLVIGLVRPNSTTMDSAIASPGQTVSLTSDGGNYTIFVNGIGPAAPPPVPPVPSPSGPTPSLSLGYSRAPCPGESVTITSSSGDAEIRLMLTNPSEGEVGQQTAGSDGTATFSLSTNGTYEADASKAGYAPGTATFTFTTCAPPPPPANVTPPKTSPGPANQTFNCSSDANCLDNQKCVIPTGATVGSCMNLTGCGNAANHTFTPYQCGSDPVCPPCGYGQTCLDHICTSFDLRGPNSGFVGQNTNVQAVKDNSVCVACDIVITDPIGNKVSGKTNSTGDFSLQLVYTGIYDVSYLENGTVVRTLQIQALPSAATEQPPPRPATSIASVLGSLWPFALALVIIIAAVVYWRLRSGNRLKRKRF